MSYPAAGTTYTLRTYLGSAPGEATYLVDEQVVVDPSNITVNIPTEGTLMPTGSYYVTSFLMAEKTTTVNDGNGNPKEVTVPAAIASRQFNDLVSYTNINPYQPAAPASVRLTFTGNEVMRAEWTKVDDADGYRVTIYQEKDGGWINTGFGYDLDGNTTSIDMALTVGGNAVSVNGSSAASVPAENLSANQTYKVGVSAYKLVPTGLEEPESTNTEGENTENTGAAVENALNPNKAFQGAKYYSSETESNYGYLPEYEPLNISLAVNSVDCAKDENGVFHAYVGDGESLLTVTCAEANSIKVTRMDTNGEISQNEGEATFTLPEFTGSLMFKIDGIKDKDVTSVFLLVSRDETAPVLTLSDPIFYADRNTGAYQITGTADAGSEILYQDDEGAKSVYAAGDGSFTINGVLDEGASSDSLYLRAQDSAGNLSKQQLALVARQAEKQPDPSDSSSGGSYTPAYPVETPEQTPNGTITVSPKSASKGTTVTITVQPDPGYELGDLVVADEKGGLLKLTDKGNGKYTFTMPGSKVEVKATFMEDNSVLNFFYDVPNDAFFYEAVKWAVKSGVTNGLSDTMFGPYESCTRAQIVTFLWRAAGSPEPKTMSSFTDVPASTYYAKAVAWAIENGITNGMTETTFAPNATCTRGQSVTFLHRALKGTASGSANFTDVKSDTFYADAINWAVANNVTNGTSNTTFSPNADCTRAEIVTFLYRAYQGK